MSKLIIRANRALIDPNDLAFVLWNVVVGECDHGPNGPLRHIIGSNRYTLDHEHALKQGDNHASN